MYSLGRNTQSVCVCVFVCVLMGQDAVIVYRERYTLLQHVDPRQPERDRERQENSLEPQRVLELVSIKVNFSHQHSDPKEP